MTHLTDEQLVELLYQDGSPEELRANQQHLDECAACQEQLNSFQATSAILDKLKTTDDAIDFAQPLRSIGETRLVPSVWNRTTWATLAASLLLFMGAAGFWLGSQYQNERLTKEFSKKLEKFRAEEIANATKNVEQFLRSHIDQANAQQLERLDELGTARDLVLAEKLSAKFSSLSKEQTRLRKQIETLAINAESEIISTNQELERLINYLEPSL